MKNSKGDFTLTYRVAPNSMLSYTYHVALLDNVYQRSNRFRLKDYLLQQHAIQFQSAAFSFKMYTNSENTGNSYNLRSMAENLDRNFKSDAVWYADYAKAFTTSTTSGASIPEALNQARLAADLGRYQPGMTAYKEVLAKLQQINNWDLGAALKVQARLVHVEAQWNVSQNKFLQALKMELLLEQTAEHISLVPMGTTLLILKKETNQGIFFILRQGLMRHFRRNFGMINCTWVLCFG